MWVSGIYESIMGELPLQGYPAVVLRLAGCNLRCTYCDASEALVVEEGKNKSLTVDQVVRKVRSFDRRMVLVTGGEPLSQVETPEVVRRLLSEGLEVVLETNGTYDVSCIPGRVTKVVDVKCPGSGSSGSFLVSILGVLGPHDRLKFVLRDREDYLWSLDFLKRHGLLLDGGRAPGVGVPGILFSPVHGDLDPAEAARWILEDRVMVQLNFQLHKSIGLP
jgi:7-carboxy-7-deazaguanine synthase